MGLPLKEIRYWWWRGEIPVPSDEVMKRRKEEEWEIQKEER